ncbi:MAG: hypothetical protein E7354_02735 [Clostridiales bacterium]|nr:hypothetical protein [Clostridiales bacterium]
MEKKISILSELIEQSSEASKLIVSNAIAMDNGEIEQAQKYLKEATTLLTTMLKDTFIEVRGILNENTTDEESYDFSALDMAKLLSKVSFYCASLINCYINNYTGSVMANTETKLIKCINATRTLVTAILLN